MTYNVRLWNETVHTTQYPVASERGGSIAILIEDFSVMRVENVPCLEGEESYIVQNCS